MSVLDLTQANRLFYGGVEARRLYYGSALLWEGYDPDALALFGRFDVTPTDARKRLISDMFVAGKATTWWSKATCLYITAAHDAQAARLNWRSTSYTLLPVNGPAFVVDGGYSSDGVASYCDTQFNPSIHSGFAQNSASMFMRINTDASANNSIMGFWANPGSTLNPRDTNNRIVARINQSVAGNSGAGSSPSSVGMFGVSRQDSASITMARNGSVFPWTSASAPVANGSILLGGITSTSLRAGQFSHALIASGLTDAEVASHHAWFETYRIALGIT